MMMWRFISMNDLALNVDHILKPDDCDAFNSLLMLEWRSPLHRPCSWQASHLKTQSTMKPGPHTTPNNPFESLNVIDRSREPYSALILCTNALIEQNNCDRLELEKVKQHYKELFDSIKILRAHTSEKTSTMLNEIESLKSSIAKQSAFSPVTLSYQKFLLLAMSKRTHCSEAGQSLKATTKKNRSYLLRKEEIRRSIIRLRTKDKSNGMCVVNVLNSVNATPTVRIVLHKEKQIWKPKGKLSDNSLNKTKQIWKPKGKLSDNSLNKTKQIWKPKSKLSDNSLSKTQRVWKATETFAIHGFNGDPQNETYLRKTCCGSSNGEPTGKKFALEKCRTGHACIWTSCSKHMTGKSFKLMNFVEKSSAILDSDLEMAFRKHTCFVRDLNGTDTLRKSWLQFVHDIEKFQAKADSGIFLGYAPSSEGLIGSTTRELVDYGKQIHVTFDEMDQTMAPVRISSGPVPVIMTSGQLKSGLAPTDKELEMLFQPMFDEHLEQSRVDEPVPSATEVNAQVVPPSTSLSTTIAQDAPSTSASSSTSDSHLPVQHQEIPEDTPIIHDVPHPSNNLVTGDPGSAQSSSGNVNAAEPIQVNYPPDHIRRWTKDHPLDNIVGNPSRPVSTRKQLASDALWCCFHTELSKVEPKNFKMAVIEDCWFQAMQDEIHEFDRLEVWELVPRPIYVMVIALKWIYKVYK
ncbi:retrovirus-related pol polyprotein from transposon TNT 1-94 [Tanacetum coccineum]